MKIYLLTSYNIVGNFRQTRTFDTLEEARQEMEYLLLKDNEVTSVTVTIAYI